ncbi:DUF1616 domain-containing protein [Halomarina litorea]|uniref:DUF1616 domain-containing protein n=1 Tax=Halomarina litorea TaxID=2961595 RepID=UPI0020C47A7D|nr:DUF1616 domain-containing protein [Halomarina sp. BCD28]
MDARLLLPRPVRRLPADLAAVVLATLLTNLFVLAPLLRETPVRIVFGLVFVLFVPGYAFIAALFPEAGSEPGADGDPEAFDEPLEDERGISGLERVALSLGTSIAIVPLIGLVLNFTPFGIRLVPILASVSLFTLGCVAVGARRRWRLPADERLVVPYREWATGVRTELFEPDTRGDAILNVVMVISILLAVSSVGYAVMVPKEGESFTELYLLTQNETGDLVADDYPTNFTRGEGQSLYVGVGNHEHERVNYTVVVELQRVDVQYFENGTRVSNVTNATNVTNVSVEVLEEEELQRFSPTVGDNETWQERHTVTPTLTGDRLRLVYLLYKGDVPAEPTTENAYREVHLWVNVSGDERRE